MKIKDNVLIVLNVNVFNIFLAYGSIFLHNQSPWVNLNSIVLVDFHFSNLKCVKIEII